MSETIDNPSESEDSKQKAEALDSESKEKPQNAEDLPKLKDEGDQLGLEGMGNFPTIPGQVPWGVTGVFSEQDHVTPPKDLQPLYPDRDETNDTQTNSGEGHIPFKENIPESEPITPITNDANKEHAPPLPPIVIGENVKLPIDQSEVQDASLDGAISLDDMDVDFIAQENKDATQDAQIDSEANNQLPKHLAGELHQIREDRPSTIELAPETEPEATHDSRPEENVLDLSEADPVDPNISNLKKKGWVDLSVAEENEVIDPSAATYDLKPVPEVFKPDNFVDVEAKQRETPDDLYCKRCNYHLKGLRLVDQCPDCGLAVIDSMQGKELVLANTEWIQCLKSGTVLIIAFILTRISLPFIHTFFHMPQRDDLLWLGWSFILFFGLCGGAAFIWGVYLITQREPRLSGKDMWRAKLNLNLPQGDMKAPEQGDERLENDNSRQLITLFCAAMGVMGMNLALCFEMSPMDAYVQSIPLMIRNLLLGGLEMMGVIAFVEIGRIFWVISTRVPSHFFGLQAMVMSLVLSLNLILSRFSQMELVTDYIGQWSEVFLLLGSLWMIGVLFLLLTDIERVLEASKLMKSKYSILNSPWMQ